MRLAFEAAMVAKALAKFTREQVDGMQIVVDTESRKVSIEVVGQAEAKQFLLDNRAWTRHCRREDIIEWAGALILELEEERTHGPDL